MHEGGLGAAAAGEQRMAKKRGRPRKAVGIRGEGCKGIREDGRARWVEGGGFVAARTGESTMRNAAGVALAVESTHSSTVQLHHRCI